jgi:hypothetical protein
LKDQKINNAVGKRKNKENQGKIRTKIPKANLG